MSDGRHGFEFGVDVRLAPGMPHDVEVLRSADAARVCAKQVDTAEAIGTLLMTEEPDAVAQVWAVLLPPHGVRTLAGSARRSLGAHPARQFEGWVTPPISISPVPKTSAPAPMTAMTANSQNQDIERSS
ncbi:hypothetical protein [Methylobacterium sp. J-070]|uniref:hypothetical protein n=1 Tax=Methylobacterium sp. J-070 TaxID=2836650 RepID=UPI001FBA9752|nr:hypothetical protein [Methylobacterium sp. J-070]MCJ2048787.1 hypothetical protein [Methylobacterium sp. J-070]